MGILQIFYKIILFLVALLCYILILYCIYTVLLPYINRVCVKVNFVYKIIFYSLTTALVNVIWTVLSRPFYASVSLFAFYWINPQCVYKTYMNITNSYINKISKAFDHSFGYINNEIILIRKVSTNLCQNLVVNYAFISKLIIF